VFKLFFDSSQDEWREVLQLICGQIDEAFVGRIVELLATQTDFDKWDGQTPLPEFLTAVQCAAEVRNVIKIENVCRKLFWQVASMTRRPFTFDYTEKFLLVLLDPFAEIAARTQTLSISESEFLSFGDEFKDEVNYRAPYYPRFAAAVGARRHTMEQFARDRRPMFRQGALIALAAKWPDEATRALLAQRAVEDDNYAPRRAALQALAEKWPDEATRALLEQRAVEDDHEYPRRAALQALAEKWPDEATRALLAQRALQDPDDQVRGAVFAALGTMHSQFGRILPTRYLNGREPYLDPLQPTSRGHIQQAAKKTYIRPDDIDARVASLSAHLGWDVTRGAKPSGEGKVRRKGCNRSRYKEAIYPTHGPRR